MSQRIFGKLFSLVIGVAALGFFYSGEAFAGKMCYKTGTTQCKPAGLVGSVVIDTNAECQTKYGGLGGTWLYDGTATCSLSGTVISFNGSVISCLSQDPVGFITARRATTNAKAVWSEFADNVSCTFDGDPNSAGIFDMFIEYTLDQSPSQATCHPAQGNFDELRWTAHCGSSTPRGYLKYVGAGNPPSWVQQLCTDSQGKPADCKGNFVMVLDGFQIKNGEIDLKACLTNFPIESGLDAGQVLIQIDKYPLNTNCGANDEPRIDSTDAKRRMCQNHTFFNPLYDEETGQGTVTAPPCAPLKNVSFRGGIGANDAAQIEGVELADRQWSPNAALNLSCQNKGTVPTTLLNSGNFAASSFTGAIEAFVKNFPNAVTKPKPGGVTVIFDGATPTGLRIAFSDCTGSDNKGMDEIICLALTAPGSDPNAATVDLVIRGTPSGDGLGFIGEATGVNINNPGNCTAVLK
jgi:hypothetical protein